jgi:TrmH family RNA methyltransferase
MKLDDVSKLHQKKFRRLLGHFLVEGEHLLLELQKAAGRNPALLRSRLYLTREHADWKSPFETQLITGQQMARISDTRQPQGIVAVVPMLPTPPASDRERAVYLHEVQDPGNLGTILRTLAWFGDLRCLLGPGSVDPYNPKAVRASMGAIFHVPIETDVALVSLRGRFARIACLDMQGEPLHSSDFRTYDCYLFGNEARGLPHASLDSLGARSFTVAGCGAIESLNLASVVNMCVYELNRQGR